MMISMGGGGVGLYNGLLLSSRGSRLRMTLLLLLLTFADYQLTKTMAKEEEYDKKNLTSSAALAPPVELTHLFMNKDGTLDSSRLFSNVNQFFPKLKESSKSSKSSSEVFATSNNTQRVAHSGSTVTLACSVSEESHLEMIMWARQLEGANKSYQILTIGESTHINDNRFLVPKSTVNNDWSLRIQRVEAEDSGAYKCQANSHPPQFITTYLSIHVAYAQIDGPPEKFIKAGSALVLNCTFRRITEQPGYVFWYHNSRMISHDRGRGQSVEINGNYSILRLPHVTTLDSGNYTCAPHNLTPDMAVVHILGGSGLKEVAEETAAAAVQDDHEPIAATGDHLQASASNNRPLNLADLIVIHVLIILASTRQ